jgi:ParB family chromosome partitioning protein
MAKMTLPAVNLDLTLEKGRMKAITEAATGKSTEYVVRVDQLRTIPGFNVRVRETDDYRQHLDALKQSIRENGFYANKPLAGYIGKEGDDDVIYVTDGHTRLEAVQEINAEALNPGEGLEGLPVVLKPADSNVADLTIALVQDNSGRPLTPYEMGVVVQRLAGMKDGDGNPMFTKAEIARKLSITERYIDDLNVLVGAPAKVRTAVLEGSVSSTLAIQELRRNPKKAEERITAAVQKARSQGRTKATRKHVENSVRMQTVRETVSIATGDSIKDVLKAMAAKVREVVGHDGADVLTTDGKLTVVIEVPAPEPAPKAAAAKPAKAAKAAKPAKAPKAAKTTKAAAAKPAKATGAKKANGGAPAAAPAADKPAIPLTADDDGGEPAKMPPAVPTVDADADPDNI